MTGWVILVDQPRDLPNAETPHKVITTSEYLARPRLFEVGRPKLVNLARSYAYQSKGYDASLLAEARAIAWCRPSRPCSNCASKSCTSTRCPISKRN